MSFESQKDDTEHHDIFSNIGLDMIDYNSKYRRCRGTLSQVIKSLEDMNRRLNEPINDYQKNIYPMIQSQARIVINKYNELLANVLVDDYYVFGRYLNGYHNNGSRRKTFTRHEQKTYESSEYKETLKSIRDRARHIQVDCMKKCNSGKYTNRETFERMVIFCSKITSLINERFNEWDRFIGDIQKHETINKNTS